MINSWSFLKLADVELSSFNKINEGYINKPRPHPNITYTNKVFLTAESKFQILAVDYYIVIGSNIIIRL